MQEMDIKKGHFKNIEGEKLGDIIKGIFGDFKKDGEKYIVTYGALSPLTIWLKDKNTLTVDTQMKKDVDEPTAISTREKYNDFLFKATGFNSKQRRDRLTKKATHSDA
jgi:hypothetical protein